MNNKNRGPCLKNIIGGIKEVRNLSGAPSKRTVRQKKPQNSLSIGPQPHINRLKRFFCDNIDKQNQELADKIQFVPSHFSHHLKSLISDRLNSAKMSNAPTFFMGMDLQAPFSNGNNPRYLQPQLGTDM